jgi:hypothetical protein
MECEKRGRSVGFILQTVDHYANLQPIIAECAITDVPAKRKSLSYLTISIKLLKSQQKLIMLFLQCINLIFNLF